MKLYILLGLLLSSLLVVGCIEQPPQQNDDTPTPSTNVQFVAASDKKIHQFESEDELIALLQSTSGGYYGGVGLGRSMGMPTTMAMEESVDMAVSDTVSKQSVGSGGSDTDFSETNVQVAGIDEGDIIKTDGEYIYTATGETLFIVKAGDEAKVVNSIDFENPINGLFLHDDVIVVMTQLYGLDNFRAFQSSFSKVQFFDMSDKEDLELEEEFVFEGYIQETRMDDHHVYIVTQSSNYLDDGYPWPIVLRDDEIMPVPLPRISYIGMPYRSTGFVNVHEVTIHDYELESTSVVVDSGFEMYMSHDNIFIATPQYVNEWEIQQDVTKEILTQFLTDEDKDLIAKIESVDSLVLSQSEKDNKILNVYGKRAALLDEDEMEDVDDEIQKETKRQLAEFKYFVTTVLQRIDLETLEVQASGEVAGTVNNQFSMDEDNSVLRIATTVPQRWSSYISEPTESENHVYTLDQDLAVIDSVTGIAKTEQIYSTRFIADRLYMVTFRQVDPFFVIDLSDPENIDIVGELKIPGFSRYLHPYDENVIIGIGQDADEDTGRTTGLKISLFDVSDVANPEEIASYVGDDKYAGSNALYEHKAFLFSKEKNLLVIPVYNYDWQDESDSYNGAFVFDIHSGSIELRGLISHETGGRYWSAAVERSLYIDDLLYTKSPTLIRVNALRDLEAVTEVELKGEQDFDIY